MLPLQFENIFIEILLRQIHLICKLDAILNALDINGYIFKLKYFL